jgi:hypothetical protein
VTVILSRVKSEDTAVVEAYISHLNQIAGDRTKCRVKALLTALDFTFIRIFLID